MSAAGEVGILSLAAGILKRAIEFGSFWSVFNLWMTIKCRCWTLPCDTALRSMTASTKSSALQR